MVSTATRLSGSCRSSSSRIASLIASQILSGWPSVTDSEVKRREVTAGFSYLKVEDRCLLAGSMPLGGTATSSGGNSGYGWADITRLGHRVPSFRTLARVIESSRDRVT